MKLGALLCALAWPACCIAQFTPAIQPLREFDLRLVATGHWHPTSVDWDSEGRMWLATSAATTGVVATDEGFQHGPSRFGRVLVFESNGGTLRSPKVFHSGPAVRGFVFHRDGIVAGTDAGAVWFHDTDADGIADRKEAVFRGPSAVGALSGLRHGSDGWIYAWRDGSKHGLESGIVRFRPVAAASSPEMVARISSPAAHFDIGWDGELFFSRAEGPHLSHVGLFEDYFGPGGITNAACHRKVEDHPQAWAPRATKVASRDFNHKPQEVPFRLISGACIYEGGAWPERFHGNFYTCDPELRLVHEDVISRAESAYYDGTRRLAGEFITAEESFRPHVVRYGPDGALYILDSSPRLAPTPARADRSAGLLSGGFAPHGRVWRLQHKQARPLALPSLASAPGEELAGALEHANGWVRQTALRLLVHKDDPNAPAHLRRLLHYSRAAHARVAAVWGLQRLGALDHATWTNAITDFHPAVQKNAWLALADSQKPITREIEKLVEKRFKDSDERVRVAMLTTLSQGPLSSDGRQWLARLFPDLKDIWCKSVALTVARETPLEFLKVAFASDKSESYRELAVPLVEQVALEEGGQAKIEALAAKHREKKTEKLTAAVKEALAKQLKVER